jgi:hypothetical protein
MKVGRLEGWKRASDSSLLPRAVSIHPELMALMEVDVPVLPTPAAPAAHFDIEARTSHPPRPPAL